MVSTQANRATFGDFQTPDYLALEVSTLIQRVVPAPQSIVEPTCGTGAFLSSSALVFPKATALLGFEINPDYTKLAQSVQGAKVYVQDFFANDWPATLNALEEPLLIIGNPPWITNSAIGVLGTSNLPVKSNFQEYAGIEALTGASNFDVSEWMMLHLLECLTGRSAALAMLCKTSVARKVLNYVWRKELQISESMMFSIDATKHFSASVDACLLLIVLQPGHRSTKATTFSSLDLSTPHRSELGRLSGRLVGDVAKFGEYQRLAGHSPLKWRSGIKHDSARLCEFRPLGSGFYQNGLEEVVELEATSLYPLLKGSDVANRRDTPSRYMLVTQRFIGDSTTRLEIEAPKTWSYLVSRGEIFENRRSSIYRGQPRFAQFGIGDYTFAPWKVAISGFSKNLDFLVVGPHEGKSVVLDDTCYFLPCHSESDADTILGLLNSKAARGLLQSLVFWDTKRPVTARMLSSLDLGKLAEEFQVDLPVWRGGKGHMPLPGQQPALFVQEDRQETG